jgi:hypothetical protein
MAKQCPLVLSWYVGPVGVKEIAAKIRRAGFRAEPGTEMVHVGVPRKLGEHKSCDKQYIGEAMLRTISRSAGTTFGLKAHDAHAAYNVDITAAGGRRRRHRTR